MKRLLIVALALLPLAACSHSREQNSSGSSVNTSQGTSAQPNQYPTATQAPTNLRASPQPAQSGASQSGSSSGTGRGSQ